VLEKKKEDKKRKKKQDAEETTTLEDDAANVRVTEAPSTENEPSKPKDKKKKKSKKVHSSSTHIALEISMSEKHNHEPKGTEKILHQDPAAQHKISELRTESSNSCLDPPSFKVKKNSFLKPCIFLFRSIPGT
jgi:hypothetical protein